MAPGGGAQAATMIASGGSTILYSPPHDSRVLMTVKIYLAVSDETGKPLTGLDARGFHADGYVCLDPDGCGNRFDIPPLQFDPCQISEHEPGVYCLTESTYLDETTWDIIELALPNASTFIVARYCTPPPIIAERPAQGAGAISPYNICSNRVVISPGIVASPYFVRAKPNPRRQ
jgi:hypothetical protein